VACRGRPAGPGRGGQAAPSVPELAVLMMHVLERPSCEASARSCVLRVTWDFLRQTHVGCGACGWGPRAGRGAQQRQFFDEGREARALGRRLWACLHARALSGPLVATCTCIHIRMGARTM